jgi:hypothetical protein
MTNFEFKVEAVKGLRSKLSQLEKKVQESIKLIDQEGISRHYSINSDIFEMATEIYKISAMLGYLATFDLKFLDEEKK